MLKAPSGLHDPVSRIDAHGQYVAPAQQIQRWRSLHWQRFSGIWWCEALQTSGA